MTPSDSSPAIVLDDIYAAYSGRPALEGVSLEVSRGSFAALLGPNGAGKSTLLRIVLGLVEPVSGRVEVFGRPPGASDAPVGYVPQAVSLPRGFPISVAEVVLMGRYGLLGAGRRPGAEDRRRSAEALDQVQMGEYAQRRFQDLSGGQQQRVLIARALAGEPELLLLDEPTGGLDAGSRARFYALVCDLQHERGLTLLCATHDLDVVAEHADELILLDRSIRLQGPTREVLHDRMVAQGYPVPADHRHASHGHGPDHHHGDDTGPPTP